MPKTNLTVAQRFWAKVNKNGPSQPHCLEIGNCWEWTASTTVSFGYGQLSVDGKPVRAHRLAWFLETGVWPTQQVLHKCDNPPCVRFSHLFQGTPLENTRDCKTKGRNPYLEIKDRIGQRFGNLVVESLADVSRNRQARFNCRCDCTRKSVVQTGHLQSGHTTTCGHRNCPYRRMKSKGWQVRDAVQEARVSYEIYKLEGEL